MLDNEVRAAPAASIELKRARRLFEFLTRAQELKSAPVRDLASYEYVLWLGDLPKHTAVRLATALPAPAPDEAVMTLNRVRLQPHPVPTRSLKVWLDFEPENSSATPRLATFLPAGRVGAPPQTNPDDKAIELTDHPEVQREFEAWLPGWTSWAKRDLVERRLQDVYKALFNAYVKATSRSEEFELVLGTACLSWNAAPSPAVRRHLFVTPVRLDLDEQTGALTAMTDQGAGLTFEIDALDPGQVPQAFDIQTMRNRAGGFDAHPLDQAAVGELGRQVLHGLGPEGSYADTLTRPLVTSAPQGAFAPAIILRSRTSRGLVQVFRDISAQLEDAIDVPEGLRPLVDPDFAPSTRPDRTPGGIVAVGTETFLAKPVNERQREVIDNVDTHAQTLVQGPPGTGKTHTAAALLTHLLAQGKRVLVTAQTDRALKEVREKLPTAIQPLAVSVVGATRTDMVDLKTAVERISSEAADHSATRSKKATDQSLEAIDEYSHERAFLLGRLRQSREAETTPHAHLGYRGTLASIAHRFRLEREAYEWLLDFVQPGPDSTAPLSNVGAVEWLDLLNDVDLRVDEDDALRALSDLDRLPAPAGFNALIDSERDAGELLATFAAVEGHAAFSAICRLAPAQRLPLQQEMRDVSRRAHELERRHEPWLDQALRDVRSGRGSTWAARSESLARQIEACTPFVIALNSTTRIGVLSGDLAVHARSAAALLPHLQQGMVIKVTPSGAAKAGALAPKPVKQAASFLAEVVVDGLPPTSAEQVRQFLLWNDCNVRLDALDRAWPSAVVIPEEDTAEERLQWHRTELEQLQLLLGLSGDLAALEHTLDSLDVPRPDWNDLSAIEAYGRIVDAAAAREGWTATTEPLRLLDQCLRGLLAVETCAPVVGALQEAVTTRDAAAYRHAHHRLRRLHEARRQLDHQESLASTLEQTAPRLRTAVEASANDQVWRERLGHLEEAWAWAATGVWLVQQERADVNSLQRQLNEVEARLHREVESLSATRAWQHAVSPQRLTGTARADLTQYAQLVRRLGKGTGKYATAQRAEIRSALDRCSSAVPVWIMPIYRIAEQLNVRQNMFDVVVVDEASQAGMEATFLQYLAAKIVVIGDDKQVSPSAVGLDRQQLRDLANHYLRDDRYRASWQDPERSLFDEAKMRYGNLITLTEHRRCVPEIIGFSNRIAYEPEGIRLVPVRQYGSDRLAPISTLR